MRITLVDTTDEQRARWGAALRREELDVTATDSNAAGFAELDDRSTSAVLLWSNHSSQRAHTAIRKLRRRGLWAPIVVMLAEPDADETVRLLDAGADDVLVVPLDADEFVARVRALLRRCQPDDQAALTFEDLEVDRAAHRVERAGRSIELTSRELDLLVFFVTHQRRVLSREEIGRGVWCEDGLPDSNVIDVMVGRLRKKLTAEGEVPLLHTVIRRGYMLSVTPPGRGD